MMSSSGSLPSASSPASALAPVPLAGPVVVVGLGVLGGSVARSLRLLDPTLEVVGVDPDPLVTARVLSEGVLPSVDPSGDAAVADAAVVVLATPLSALPEFLRGPGAGIPSTALITDLVGVNAPVLNRATQAGLAGQWVTAAPALVTGATGFGASRSGLLDGVELRLSATEAASDALRARGEAFWQRLGARTLWMDARDHDILTAWSVLLPQLVSNALAGALHAAGVPPEALSPQARSMVQLAETDPARWTELLEALAPAAGTGLTSVSRATNVVADLLAGRHVDRIAEFMDRTHAWATDPGVAMPQPVDAPNPAEAETRS